MYTFDPIQPFYPGEKKQFKEIIKSPKSPFMPMSVCKHLTTTTHQKLVYKPLQHQHVFSVYSGRSKLRSKLDRNKLGTNHEPTYQ